jgi:hypothetical protein
MEKEIIIEPKFVFKEYFKVNLYLAFSTLLFKVILILNICALFFILVGTFLKTTNNLSFEPFIIITLYSIILIFFIYTKTKKSLKNPKIKEAIKLKFNNSFFEEVGETYNIKYNWKEIYNIKETNKWFLIFIQKKQAKVIVISDLKDNQYNELKELFGSLNIKKSLK